MKAPRVKEIVILILLAFIACNKKASNEKKPKNDLELENIKGQVKSITEISYEVNDTLHVSNNNQVYYINLSIFDPRGNKIICKTYSSDSTPFGTTVYKYNKLGQKIGEYGGSEYNGYTSESKIIYRYNAKGQLAVQKRYNFTGVDSSLTLYKFNDSGNLIEEIFYYLPKGKPFKTYYKYDGKGNRTEWVEINSDGKIQTKYLYKYDSHGNCIEDLQFNSLNGKNYKTLYRYDNQRNKTQSIYFTDDGKLFGSDKIDYDYDNFGNWTRKVEWQKGKLMYITKRNIEYYHQETSFNLDYSNNDSLLKQINSKQESIFKGKEILICVESNGISEKFDNRKFVKEDYLKGYPILSNEFVKYHLFGNVDSVLISGDNFHDEGEYKIAVDLYMFDIDFYQRDTILKTKLFTGIIFEEVKDDGSEKFLYTFDKKGKVISRLSIAFYQFSGIYSTGDENEKIPWFIDKGGCITNDFTIKTSILQGDESEFKIMPEGKIIRKPKKIFEYYNKPSDSAVRK